MAAGPATTLLKPLTKLLIVAACLHATRGCGYEATPSCCSTIAAADAIAEAATAADVVKGAESTWLNIELHLPLIERSAGGLPFVNQSVTTIHECLPAANVAKVPKINAASGGTLGCDVRQRLGKTGRPAAYHGTEGTRGRVLQRRAAPNRRACGTIGRRTGLARVREPSALGPAWARRTS